jgi:RNA polymerase sigma-70 factor, ECF subfamily
MALFKTNYKTKSDEELMAMLTKGEQSAFDQLYERYSKPLLNFFFRMLNRDREKAEDMLHDLFLKIIEKPKSFDDTKKFSTWFYTLASNMIKNEYRKLQVRNDFANIVITENYNPVELNGESIDKDIFANQLATELNKMDVDLKTMFNLRYVEEMSIKEIAEIFNCPEGTVKSRLFYLTKNLSTRLAAFKPEKA